MTRSTLSRWFVASLAAAATIAPAAQAYDYHQPFGPRSVRGTSPQAEIAQLAGIAYTGPVQVPGSDGFDWSDAAVGAAAGALLAAFGVLAVRTRRRPAHH